MSQGALCSNLSQKVQKEVSQMANCNFSHVILLGGLSVNLNHLKQRLLGEKSYSEQSNSKPRVKEAQTPGDHLDLHLHIHANFHCK